MAHEANDYLTIPEKRNLLDNIRELTKYNALTVKDRDAIFDICFRACEREIAKGEEKK